ncbi:hypothetical protein [Weizmannia acidilactici]|uniref:hypothetical protein n=1 Tax=Weizmannia acidilactici TaxID=2607726 RepID=UPI00124D2B12|nr:hypothetical protein [Weizmannia acidilactici]
MSAGFGNSLRSKFSHEKQRTHHTGLGSPGSFCPRKARAIFLQARAIASTAQIHFVHEKAGLIPPLPPVFLLSADYLGVSADLLAFSLIF